jgi:hypothetical protein
MSPTSCAATWEAPEYKHVVLGLVFLKYVSEAFTARCLELETVLADPESDDHIPSEARRERILCCFPVSWSCLGPRGRGHGAERAIRERSATITRARS